MPPSKFNRPKRPLSGYNLFYRYKRNKVLEATAALLRADASASPAEEKSVIDDILAAPPGLEGVCPGHSIWGLPPPAIDEFRSSNIRIAMDGKLFPNENTRDRLHRKVHGMGFVEMGKVMRETWAGMDLFTKEVFCDLADVGRVRYRRLMVEYKLRESAEAPITDPGGEGGDGQDKEAKQAVSTDPEPSTRSAAAVSPAVVATTPNTPKKTSVLTFVSPSPFAGKQQVGITPISSLRRTNSRLKHCNSNDPPVVLCGVIAPTPCPGDKHNSSNSCLDSLEPLALHPPRYQRHVSNFGANDSSFVTKAYQDVNAELQKLLKGIIIPSLPLAPRTSISTVLPGAKHLGGTAHLDEVNNRVRSQGATMSQEEVSDQDFLELLNTLDDALETHCISRNNVRARIV